jgi:hypothetical protein
MEVQHRVVVIIERRDIQQISSMVYVGHVLIVLGATCGTVATGKRMITSIVTVGVE